MPKNARKAYEVQLFMEESVRVRAQKYSARNAEEAVQRQELVQDSVLCKLDLKCEVPDHISTGFDNTRLTL
jgi:hypothetical protein